MPANRSNASATVSRSGSANGSAARPRKVRCVVPAAVGRQRQEGGAVGHQRLVRLAGAIPFEHGEFGMMQRRRARGCGRRGRSRTMRRSPAASSFLQANSGEVCR